MPNETTPLAGENSDKNTPPIESGRSIESLLDEIKTLRAESARHRVKAKDAEAAAAAQWQQLAADREREITELAPYKQKAADIEAAFTAMLEEQLTSIPEAIRKALVDPVRSSMPVTDFSKWLKANLPTLKAPIAPNLDPGATSTTKTAANTPLTPAQKHQAQMFGMSETEYREKYLG